MAYYPVYKAVSWQSSTVRSMLNSYGPEENAAGEDYSSNGFLSSAFSETELAAVVSSEINYKEGLSCEDKIFLLSYDEVRSTAYGFSSSASGRDAARQCRSSSYAKARGAQFYISGSYAGCSSWWLRTSGYSAYDAYYASAMGNVTYYYTYETMRTVRPALRLKLSAGGWSYAGSCDSMGNADSIAAGALNGTDQISLRTVADAYRNFETGGADGLQWDLDADGALSLRDISRLFRLAAG